MYFHKSAVFLLLFSCALNAPAQDIEYDFDFAKALKEMESPDPAVRGQAVRVLKRIRPHNVSDSILKGYKEKLSSSDPAVLETGLQILIEGEFGEKIKFLFPEIKNALVNSNFFVNAKAFNLLKSLGPMAQELLPDLQKLTKHDQSYIRSSSFEVLGAIGPSAKGAAPQIILGLQDSDSWVRVCAIRAAGAVGVKEAIPQLKKLSSDSDATTRSSALNALRALGEQGGAEAEPQTKMASEKKDFQPVADPDLPEPVGPSFSSEEFSNQVCHVVCGLREKVKFWSDINHLHEQNGDPLSSYDVAILSMQLSFLVKSAPFCGTDNDLVKKITHILLKTEGNKICSSQEQVSQAELLRFQLQKILGNSRKPVWSPAEVYAKQFSLVLIQELIHRQSDHHKLKQLKYLQENIAGQFSADLAKATTTKLTHGANDNSVFNTYAFVTSLVAHPNPLKEDIRYLKEIVESAVNPFQLPYYPFPRGKKPTVTVTGDGDHSVLASSARNVPAHLALFLNEPDAALNQERLFKALNWWTYFSKQLSDEVSRDGTHKGRDWLAPYYFYPSAPYATASVVALLRKGVGKELEKKLEKMAQLQKDALLIMIQKDGLVLPMGGPNYKDAKPDYSASPTYSNPLVGLALLPLIQNGCGKTKEKSLGVLAQ